MAVIEVKNLVKVYSTGDTMFRALDCVSLNIEYGEMVAIMGPSGSGKSTFMNQIGCLDKPTSGEYYLDGVDTKDMSSNELAEIRNLKLGFVFQGFNLISKTSALENVELPMVYKGLDAKTRYERAYEAIKTVGLEERIHHHPNQMSGGQQQRVAIARAIVNDAPVILADEPTGNLDTKTSVDVMNFFVELNEKHKKTIIIVTHEDDIAGFCKRVVRFRDGKIVSDTGRLNTSYSEYLRLGGRA